MQAVAAVLGLQLRPDEAPQDAWMQVFTVAPILALSFKYALERAVSNALFLSTTYLAFSQMITLGGRGAGRTTRAPPSYHAVRVQAQLAMPAPPSAAAGVQVAGSAPGRRGWRHGAERADLPPVFVPQVMRAQVTRAPPPASAGPGLWLPTPFEHLLLAWLIVGVLLFTFGLLVWFWAAGYKRCCDGSVVYAFVFMRVEAFGWVRYFAIAVSSAMVLGIPLLITAMFALKQALEPALELGQQARRGSRWHSFVLWSGRHRKLYDGTGCVSKALFVAPLLAFSIAGTELTLRWNDIAGVYSLAGTGQLVPLLVGAGALLKALYFWWAERDSRRGRAPRAHSRCEPCAVAAHAPAPGGPGPLHELNMNVPRMPV